MNTFYNEIHDWDVGDIYVQYQTSDFAFLM